MPGFFVGFIEGISGFGTPAMLAAPLLISIGFPVLPAALISLIGDSVAVTFGAVGVPMSVGIFQGVGPEQLAALGISIKSVAVLTALFHLVLGIFIPLFISVALTYSVKKSIKDGLVIWKQAFWAGLCFLIPYFLAANFLGVEFPSIIGAIFGFPIFLLSLKFNFPRLPEKEWIFSEDENQKQKLEEDLEIKSRFVLKILKGLSSYVAFVVILFLSRLPFLPIGEFLKKFSLAGFYPFYSPGFVFLVVAIFAAIFSGLKIKNGFFALLASLKKIYKPIFVLLFVLFLTQILIYSGENNSGLVAMPLYIAELFSSVGKFWPLFAPFIGALGAFITGSSTASNLLFSDFQLQAAIFFKLPAVLILALQSVGSAVGNMISIGNILAVLAVVHASKKDETIILRRNLIPVLIYIFGAGLIGLGIIWLLY